MMFDIDIILKKGDIKFKENILSLNIMNYLIIKKESN